MSQASLKTKIKTEIEAVYGPADDPATLDKFATALSKAIATWFESDAECNPGTFKDGLSVPITGQGELKA